MPTYDYRCNSCDHEFELFQSMKDSPKRKCPECGKLKLERLIGTGGAGIFNGGGFYETDYRSESYKKDAASDKKAAEAKAESKPEPKAGSKTDSRSDAKPSKPAPKKSDSKSPAASRKK